ncbi:aldo/keto reductase [Fructobacillus fructosus]|uniref:aldo/keto reductase n=1 Tax=Fructobacillus fructosus TaxID=1631 RepID=UPI00200AE208|nr:aldo/keto reductase [Fructobacillus fructosus]MCK8638001.1 aldo/keto reductase [Fructobacillus fructosus]
MEYKVLENGSKMPLLGFGVFQVKEKGAAKKGVINAIKAGYRLIDTAASYGNEEEVGEGIELAISSGLVKREELFITSKMWVSDVSREHAEKAIQGSLKRLKLDYLDLYLIHQPYNDVFAAWRAMEKAYQVGQLKAIGVSNFSIDQLTNLAEFNKIKPMVNQIEVNPFEQQNLAAKYFDDYGVQVEAWAPFAEGRNNLFSNKTLQKIADKYDKSIAQIVLRWISQRGIVVLSKTTKPDRMEQNLNVLNFFLSEDEMNTITSLDMQTSQFFDHKDPEVIKWMATRRIDY